MEIRLTVTTGRHAGTEIPVEGTEFLIGRDAECQLRPGSEQVSRRHCAIVRTDEGALIRDFNSRNGVFVNGKRIEGEHPLKTGDRIKIGPIELEVQIRTTVGGKKKSAIHSIQEAASRVVTDANKHEDLDVAEWLVHREASEHDDQDTVTIPELMVAKKPGDEEGAEESDEDDLGLQRRASVLFHAGQDTAKPTTGNSRQAAEEVLKQLFGK